MPVDDSPRRPAARTNADEAIRTHVLEATADLLSERGVAGVSFDEVARSAGVPAERVRRLFPAEAVLVTGAVRSRIDHALAVERALLAGVTSVEDLQQWRDHAVGRSRAPRATYAVLLGPVAADLVATSETSRILLADAIRAWHMLIVTCLDRLRRRGVLRPDADTSRLATGILAALQGGFLLARTAQNSTPLVHALDAAIDHVRASATR
jgi:TetR/AcrR family transcriptional regulator, transcriptional repressor for nem operon